MEEALWSIEHTLKTRLGDGYRASSVGLGQWTDGRIGNGDDVPVRVHKHAYQNFICRCDRGAGRPGAGTTTPTSRGSASTPRREDLRWAGALQGKGHGDPRHVGAHDEFRPLAVLCGGLLVCLGVYELCGEAEFSEIARRYAESSWPVRKPARTAPMTGFFHRRAAQGRLCTSRTSRATIPSCRRLRRPAGRSRLPGPPVLGRRRCGGTANI